MTLFEVEESWHRKCKSAIRATRRQQQMKMNSFKILIVNDEEPVRVSHKHLLANQGYSVETADGGKEALKKVKAFGPELVLLDVMKSSLDGIECCRQIKTSTSTKETKVVVISSSTDYSEISQAFAAGCDDYLVKPMDLSELLLTVKEMLKFSHLKPATTGK